MSHINNFNKNIINVFPTFLCSLKCHYCINRFNEQNYPFLPLKQPKQVFSWEEWTDALNKFPKECTVVMQGGEPTMFLGFSNIINNIYHNHIRILSNLFLDISINELFKIKNKNNIEIITSMHVSDIFPDIVNIVENNINKLRSEGFLVYVDIVNTPELTEDHINYMNKNQCNLKDMLGFYNGIFYGTENMHRQIDAFSGNKRKVICRVKKEGLIAPDGNMYACTSGMYTSNKNLIIGNIFEDNYSNQETIFCDSYGLCNPCDFFEYVPIEKGIDQKHI